MMLTLKTTWWISLIKKNRYVQLRSFLWNIYFGVLLLHIWKLLKNKILFHLKAAITFKFARIPPKAVTHNHSSFPNFWKYFQIRSYKPKWVGSTKSAFFLLPFKMSSNILITYFLCWTYHNGQKLPETLFCWHFLAYLSCWHPRHSSNHASVLRLQRWRH